jgi:hypothetical protein
VIRRLRGRLGRSVSTAVAVVVLVLFVAALFLSETLVGSDDSLESGSIDAGAIAAVQYRALALGSTREEVEEHVGDGANALEFETTGVALEPMDADCLYWPQADTGDYRDIVQLCFRDDRLVRKRKYGAAGAPLG